MTWLESFWEFENFYYYYYYTNFLFNVSLFLIYSLDDEQNRGYGYSFLHRISLIIYLWAMDFLHQPLKRRKNWYDVSVVSSKVFQHFTSIADGSSMLVRIHQV